MSTNLPPPINHVFVDFENVASVDLSIFTSKTLHLTLLLGPKNTKLKTPLVEALVQNAATVELVRLDSSGRNAVDFALAYYLGRAVLANPCGYFHIVAEDTDYSPLVEHLRSKHVNLRLHKDFSTLPFLSRPQPPCAAAAPVEAPLAKPQAVDKPPPSPLPTSGRESKALEYLRKPSIKRPGSVKSLARSLKTHFGNKLTEAEALGLVKDLERAGYLFADDTGKVTYYLSPMVVGA
jgi:hypothetical protein